MSGRRSRGLWNIIAAGVKRAPSSDDWETGKIAMRDCRQKRLRGESRGPEGKGPLMCTRSLPAFTQVVKRALEGHRFGKPILKDKGESKNTRSSGQMRKWAA